MIGSLHRETLAERAAQTALAASRALAKTKKTSSSATKSSAEKDKNKESKQFTPGDLVECIDGHTNKWPLETGKVYMVAIDVIAGFNHRGPACGLILDPCPNRHGVSDGPKHPYVWDSERFIFFSHPRPVQQTFVQRPLVAPLEPYGFD